MSTLLSHMIHYCTVVAAAPSQVDPLSSLIVAVAAEEGPLHVACWACSSSVECLPSPGRMTLGPQRLA